MDKTWTKQQKMPVFYRFPKEYDKCHAIWVYFILSHAFFRKAWTLSWSAGTEVFCTSSSNAICAFLGEGTV